MIKEAIVKIVNKEEMCIRDRYKHVTTVSSIKLLAKQFNEWYIKKNEKKTI